MAKVKEGATPDQIALASRTADILEARGFEAKDLDFMVYAVAEGLGEKRGTMVSAQAEKDRLFNCEIAAADELNTTSMLNQLTVVAVYYATPEKFIEAVESELKISLSEQTAPLETT